MTCYNQTHFNPEGEDRISTANLLVWVLKCASVCVCVCVRWCEGLARPIIYPLGELAGQELRSIGNLYWVVKVGLVC